MNGDWTEAERDLVRRHRAGKTFDQIRDLLAAHGYERTIGSISSHVSRAQRRDPSYPRFGDRNKPGPKTTEKSPDTPPPIGSDRLTASGNTAILEASRKRPPRSLAELLAACDVDQAIWRVDRWVANKWETVLKQPDGSAKVQPQYQVKAWLVRRTPEHSAWPIIRPASIDGWCPLPPPPERAAGLKSCLIIPDSQNGYRRDNHSGLLDPFHDRIAWDIVCQIAEQLRPDRIILLGDMLDLPEWSDKFLLSPDMQATTQPAIDELAWWLARLAATRPDELDYLEGNHEARMARAIIKNARAAYGLRPADLPESPAALSVPGLLGLEALGIRYHAPYQTASLWLGNNLRISHGDTVAAKSGQAAARVLAEARCSEIFGHIHRIEQAYRTAWSHRGPIAYMAMSPGTIARIDDGVVPAGRSRQNWQQGFGWVEYEPDGERFDARAVPIIGGRALFGGKWWVGQDRSADIQAATGWPMVPSGAR